MPILHDTIVTPMMTGLIAALVAELTVSQLPPLNFTALFPGADVVLDMREDCDNQGWVRLVSMIPSVEPFPTQVIGPGSRYNQFAITLELGISSQTPGLALESDLEPPTTLELFGTTQLQLDYMQAMWRTICKYFRSINHPFFLGPYTPGSAQGLMVGGTWLVTVSSHEDDD